MPRPSSVLAAVAALALACATARAGGGPRDVLVVVNVISEESLEVGNTYVGLRDIPESNVCEVVTFPDLTVSAGTYQDDIERRILECIDGSPNGPRIDYIVLTPGLPIRALFPDASAPPSQPVSITALLQVMDTPLRGKDQEYGGPTYGFQSHPNPYAGADQSFSNDTVFGGYNLRIATMLSGYWSEDGNRLVERSVASDGNPPSSAPGAIFVLEDGVPAADVRNAGFPAAVASLEAQGHAAVHVTSSDPEVAGAVVASHVTSGVYSGNTRADIESNTFPPGAIVDVLESFGLTPSNFVPGLADQVPATWWVTAGATGVHGTVTEPYNVAFPPATMLEPYVAGYNLAESWYQGIPYLYWMNLVLGDPLAQPYAVRPEVSVLSPAPEAVLTGVVTLAASATTARVEGIAAIELFVDDLPAGSSPSGSVSLAWDSRSIPDGWHRLEVIARDASKFATQARKVVDVLVDNHGRRVEFLSPPDGTVVGSSFTATIDATPTSGIQIVARATTVGRSSRPGVVTPVDVSTVSLGRGLHRFVATAGPELGPEAFSAPLTLRVVKAPRLASALAPPSGPQSGGTLVSFEGWNFEPEVRVFFGANEATDVVVADANHLQATTPRGPPRAVDVRILNPADEELIVPLAFTYLAEPCPDPDTDSDGTCDSLDNCPSVANEFQQDADGDGLGDDCDCAVTAPVADLMVSREASGRIALEWQVTADPCRAAERVLLVADPVAPPAFPAGYADVTGADEDGSATDASFIAPMPAGRVVFLQVASMGSDAALGP